MISLLKKILGLVVAVVEFLLITRFVLKFFAADPKQELVQLVLNLTSPVVTPFQTLFPTPAVRGGYQLEFATVFAIFAVAFAGYLAQELLELFQKKSVPKTVSTPARSVPTVDEAEEN